MVDVLGEIRSFHLAGAPKNFHACDGSLLSIREHPTLFAILGTAFGGDGVKNFALPDLRGRAIIGASALTGGEYPTGCMVGEENVFLTVHNVPEHNHMVQVSLQTGTVAIGAGAYLAVPGKAKNQTATVPIYASQNDNPVLLHEATIQPTGGASHSNMQPFVAVGYFICTAGAFPFRE